jgi:hypothetical protein
MMKKMMMKPKSMMMEEGERMPKKAMGSMGMKRMMKRPMAMKQPPMMPKGPMPMTHESAMPMMVGIKDSGYLTKKGLNASDATMLNCLPPGENIEDQENAEFNRMPMTMVTELGYPSDGWD